MHVGLIGTGEMGSGVGACLVKHGATVITSLEGRSEASAARIRRAGIDVAATPADVPRVASIVLSIVPPDQAVKVAREFVAMLIPNGLAPVYVDCNAIAPDTAAQIGRILSDAGVRYVDAGIIGNPPRDGYDGPRMYAAGPDVAELERLNAHGLHVRDLKGPLGIASALKMSYGGLTKGITGIGAAMFACAHIGGVSDALQAEFADSQPMLHAWFTKQLPTMYPKAYRWVPEMREIATFTAPQPGAPDIYEGLAQLYASIAEGVKAKG